MDADEVRDLKSSPRLPSISSAYDLLAILDRWSHDRAPSRDVGGGIVEESLVRSNEPNKVKLTRA